MAFMMPIANVKGGSGKSITALALSRVLTEPDTAGGESMRVLMVDADPQRTISDALDIGPSRPSLAEVIRGQVAIRDSIATDGLFGCHIIPGGLPMLELYNCDPHALVDAIKEVQADYDLIVIDTPGTLDNTVQGALQTVTGGNGIVLIPTQLQYSDIKVTEFSIDQYRALGVDDYRIVAVMVDKRTAKDNVAFREQLNNISGGRLLKTEIPRTVIAARLGGGEEPDGPHARNFFTIIRQLAQEIMEEATNGA